MKSKIIPLACLVALALACWVAWRWLHDVTSLYDPNPAEVFKSVSVGDSEEQLVEALRQRGVAFHGGNGDEKTVYCTSDGFVGVYFYFVEGGRVVSKAAD
jgi:hypothetical protein